MRLPTTTALLLFPFLLATVPIPAQAQDKFGPWLLVCTTDSMTDRNACRVTHEQPVEPAAPGQSAMALEIIPREGMLVPAVTARDLGLDNPGRGLLAFTGTVQMRFPPQPMFEMPCRLEARSVVCVPKPEDMTRAAEELAGASRVLVRVIGLGSGSVEAEPRNLPLSRTADALAAFRARMPPNTAPPPPEPGFDMRDLFLRLQRFFFAE